MPRRLQIFATRTPMAPSPMTPMLFPFSSFPANSFFFFSIIFARSASFAFSFTQFTPPMMSLEAKRSPATTNSFTPFALAPGVLKTVIPFSAYSFSGILLTPAPARATASIESGTSRSCIDALRTKTASAAFKSSITSNSLVNKSKPRFEIGFKHFTVYIFNTPYLFSSSNFFMNSTNFSTPSFGIAL